MWIHPPLTSLPVGKRCQKFSQLRNKMRFNNDVAWTDTIFSGYFYSPHFLDVKHSFSSKITAYIRDSRNSYIQCVGIL